MKRNNMLTKQLLSRIQKHMVSINDDAVPFGWLYADSQKFQLSDSDFLEYLRLFIEVLFRNNGKIVYGGKGTAYDWIETKDFGETPADISLNLLKAFKTHKEQSIENNEYMFTYNVWFAKSDKDHPMYLKQIDQ